MKLEPGVILLDTYRLTRKLGEGGQGDVFEAEHVARANRVAIKVLATTGDASDAARFQREAHILTRLRSPHGVRVYDAGRLPDGRPFFVMERLRGVHLANEVAQRGTPAVDLLVGWMLDILEALIEAHGRGLVHRDVKPANIFIAESDRRARLLDFGIAHDAAGERLTATREVIGTPQFMAPEQMLRGKEIDVRADIFSIGVVLYRVLGGEFPWPSDDLFALAREMTTSQPKPIAELRNDLPAPLASAIMRAIHSDREQRFPTAREFADALRPFAPSWKPIEVAAREPTPRRSNRLAGITAFLTILLGGAAFALLAFFLSRPKPHALETPHFAFTVDASTPEPIASTAPATSASVAQKPKPAGVPIKVDFQNCNTDQIFCQTEGPRLARDLYACGAGLPFTTEGEACIIRVSYAWDDEGHATDIIPLAHGTCFLEPKIGECIRRGVAAHKVAIVQPQPRIRRETVFGVWRTDL